MLLSHRRAFTLVELLVVVAIIALLIAILLPSLARAREQAKSIRCIANQKDIAAGMITYASDDERGYLIPVNWRAVAPSGYQPGGTGFFYFQGDRQWGGKGGDPDLFNRENAREHSNKWALTHAWDFGPGDRPLNKIVFKNATNSELWKEVDIPLNRTVNLGATARLAAEQDNRQEMDVYRCPSDRGWEDGRAGSFYLHDDDVAYVRRTRGIDLGVSNYEFFGNSYYVPMNWVRHGTKFLTSTVYGNPMSRLHSPSRLVTTYEGVGEDFYRWNRPELQQSSEEDLTEWWITGWHQPDSERQVFNAAFADGHVSKIDGNVRSAYQDYDPEGDGSEFTSGQQETRGSRPEIIRIPFASEHMIGELGQRQSNNMGYWGRRLYRGDGWSLDNLPAEYRLVFDLARF